MHAYNNSINCITKHDYISIQVCFFQIAKLEFIVKTNPRSVPEIQCLCMNFHNLSFDAKHWLIQKQLPVIIGSYRWAILLAYIIGKSIIEGESDCFDISLIKPYFNQFELRAEI